MEPENSGKWMMPALQNCPTLQMNIPLLQTFINDGFFPLKFHVQGGWSSFLLPPIAFLFQIKLQVWIFSIFIVLGPD